MMNFEKHLIQLVRENDLLYNYYHPDYNKLPIRLITWEKIAEELCIETKEAQKRWQNLRRVFRRIRIKIRQTGRLPRSQWRHYDDMEFIREFDPTPGEQNIMDVKKERSNSPEDAYEQMSPATLDDIKFTEFEDIDAYEEPTENHINEQMLIDSEFIQSIVIEHIPEVAPPEIESPNAETLQDLKDKDIMSSKNVPTKAKKTSNKNVRTTCSQNLSILGAKVDAVKVSQQHKFELERKVADLVYEVLIKYS